MRLCHKPQPVTHFNLALTKHLTKYLKIIDHITTAQDLVASVTTKLLYCTIDMHCKLHVHIRLIMFATHYRKYY